MGKTLTPEIAQPATQFGDNFFSWSPFRVDSFCQRLHKSSLVSPSRSLGCCQQPEHPFRISTWLACKMTDKLPPPAFGPFCAAPSLRWVPPIDRPAEERRTADVSGIAEFLPLLGEYKDRDGYAPTESWLQRRDRKILEHKIAEEKKLTEGPKKCLSLPTRACLSLRLLSFCLPFADPIHHGRQSRR